MTAEVFKNTYLSFSRLKRFESCPLSFKLHYIDKLQSEPGVPLLFGSLLHAVLEQLYRWVIREEHVGRIPEEHATELYSEAWSRSGLSGFDLYQEGLDILKAYLREHAMVDHRDILAVEQEFRLQIGKFKVLGYIDRVDRIDDETIEVIDYKTNRLIFTREEVETNLQLTVYHMAARQLWPWVKNVRLVFHLLRHDMRMQTKRTDEQLDAAQKYIVALGTQTETAQDYPPRINTNCQYCDHRQHCPAYQEAVAGNVEVVKSKKGDLESIAREREQVANLAKILYGRKAELEKVLKAHLEDQDTIELAGMAYRISHSTQKNYPPEATLRVFVESAGIDDADARKSLLVVDNAKVDALVKKLAKNMHGGRKELRAPFFCQGGPLMRDLVFVDVETTGLEPDYHEMIEVAAARVDPRTLEIKVAMDAKVHPEHIERATPVALQQNGYTAEGWRDARPLVNVLHEITPLLNGCCIAGHNVGFDWAFLKSSYRRANVALPDVDYHLVDTASLAWPLVVAGLLERPKLDALCSHFGISNDGAHTAPADVRRTIEVYRRLMPAFDPEFLAHWFAMQADERDIVTVLAQRMHDGRREYGPWHVDDKRQYPIEALAEVMDALNYCVAELVRLERRS